MRKYLIGVALGLAGVLVLTSIASARTSSLNWTAKAAPVKQKKKKHGAVTFKRIGTADVHTGFTVPPGGPGCDPDNGVVTSACKYFPPSVRTLVRFDKDFRFLAGNLAKCNPAILAGRDAAGARAVCRRAIVGNGSSQLHSLREVPGLLNGVVTVFNGQPSQGRQTVLLHIDVIGVATSPVLVGVLRGRTLDINVPPVPGTVIENFTTSLQRKVTKKTKKGKRFFLEARCSKKKWRSSATVFYQDGTSLSASTVQKCKPRK